MKGCTMIHALFECCIPLPIKISPPTTLAPLPPPLKKNANGRRDLSEY